MRTMQPDQDLQQEASVFDRYEGVQNRKTEKGLDLNSLAVTRSDSKLEP